MVMTQLNSKDLKE